MWFSCRIPDQPRKTRPHAQAQRHPLEPSDELRIAVVKVRRIALVTDFGPGGPYVGQVRLCLAELAPAIPVVDLVSDLTPFRPDLAAYLLPALIRDMPAGTLYLGVVDPGVGGERLALTLSAGGNLFVGPDNGLLALVGRRAPDLRLRRVDWRPAVLSESFHGRDLFAPVAAMLANGRQPGSTEIDPSGMVGGDWPDDLPRILYADPYGNLVTGVRASELSHQTRIQAGGRTLEFARTFCAVPAGNAFWYENAFGLVELAVNQGAADRLLALAPGDPVKIESRGQATDPGASAQRT
jgi:S-adenosylmethionine hydrolase